MSFIEILKAVFFGIVEGITGFLSAVQVILYFLMNSFSLRNQMISRMFSMS